MKTLLIDNYDSFTYNLYHLLAKVNGKTPVIVRNNEATWPELERERFDNIVISPGPGHPGRTRDFGVSRDAIAQARIPLLGVCLGHQGIAQAFGARVGLAPEPMHGRLSLVHHDGQGLFRGIPSPFSVVRYHSLSVNGELPPELIAQARTADGVLMALRHATRPIWGVQFHPESIQTEHGLELFENFRRLSLANGARDTPVKQARRPSPRKTCQPSLRLQMSRVSMRISAETLFDAAFAKTDHAFWLDSSKLDERVSRFSYMGDGTGPRSRLVQLNSLDEMEKGLPFEEIDCGEAEIPFAFRGGYVGYLAYEGESRWLFADRFVAIDHLKNEAYVVELTPHSQGPSDWALNIQRLIETLPPCPPPRPGSSDLPVVFKQRDDRETYTRKITECLQAIREGESYELCLTNAIECAPVADPFEVYRTLRRLNPAPYAAYLNFRDHAVLSSSPERFLKVDAQGRMEARPIKGTARRSPHPLEDRRLALDLARGEKNRSENLMIVDLLRNDLGRVAEAGSIEVPRLMEVETYASVHQLVSTISGQLRAGENPLRAVQAAFPGGSMTGAPKIRSQEILQKLERAPRGIYSGALGYIGLDGAIDFSIVIRTIVARESGFSIGTGGAIVALSRPEAEFDETILKASVPMQAIALTVTGRREAYLLTGPDPASSAQSSLDSSTSHGLRMEA